MEVEVAVGVAKEVDVVGAAGVVVEVDWVLLDKSNALIFGKISLLMKLTCGCILYYHFPDRDDDVCGVRARARARANGGRLTSD